MAEYGKRSCCCGAAETCDIVSLPALRTEIGCPGPNGTSGWGYLSEAEKPKGGIIVLQEWWGVNEQICAVADRFAGEGYTALVPDLFCGRVTGDAEVAPRALLRNQTRCSHTSSARC